MNTDIFISYRREGGREIARTIYLALGKLGFQNIFFDYNSLRNGVFNEQIIDAINSCKDFIIVLSDGSMDRCVNQDDWVRKEITTAISVGCNIIPVVIDGQNPTFPDEFPKNLNIIKMIQRSTLMNNEFFDDSIRKIVGRFETKPVVNNAKPADKETLEVTIYTDQTCEFRIEGERISKIRGGKFLRTSLFKPGVKYNLEFINLGNPKEKISMVYVAPKVRKTDEIQVSYSQLREKKLQSMQETISRRKLEKTQREYDKANLKLMLKEYDKCDDKSFDNMRLVMKDNLFGFLNEKGLETIPCVYEDAVHFRDGLACVCSDGKWGMIDVEGNVVSDFNSDSPTFYTNGIIIKFVDGKFGAVDKEGNIVIEFQYDELSLPNENKIHFGKKDNKYVYLKSDGEVLSSKKYEYINIHEIDLGISKSDKLHVPTLPSFVMSNKKYGMVDKHSNLVIPCIAEDISLFYVEMWGFWRNNSLDPFRDSFYTDYHEFPNLIKIKCHNKLGLIRTDGSVVVPIVYDNIKEFYHIRDHNILLEKGGKYGVCDRSGQIMIPVEYDFILDNPQRNIIACKVHQKYETFNELEISELDRFYSRNEYLDYFIKNSSCSVEVFDPHDCSLEASCKFEKGEIIDQQYYGDKSTHSRLKEFMFVLKIKARNYSIAQEIYEEKVETIPLVAYDKIEKGSDIHSIVYKDGKCGIYSNERYVNITNISYRQILYKNHYDTYYGIAYYFEFEQSVMGELLSGTIICYDDGSIDKHFDL